MAITPLILGRGRSGQAIAKSLQCLDLISPELKLERPVWLERGASLAHERQKFTKAVLCIAQPHALHAQTILEADHAGFDAILCEKPACVNLEELQQLRTVKTPTAILHVYRQMWGPQTLKKMLDAGELGELIAIEGRYWQSSAAVKVRENNSYLASSWKNDPHLSGTYDTYLDVGAHWIDCAAFLCGEAPLHIDGWRSFVNAQAPHRDTHLQIALQFPNGRAMASISKTLHGATNHFEINVIGSKKSATWLFLNPDEILMGEGRDRHVLTRKDDSLGSRQPPHHSMGWIEGYIEIASRLLIETFNFADREPSLRGQQHPSDYPRLQENLNTLEAMLKVQWHFEGDLFTSAR